MKDIGNVWCPWEVDRVKTGYAGSIPVTSVKVLHSGGNFFCSFDRIIEDYPRTIKQRIMNLVRFITIAMILTSVKGRRLSHRGDSVRCWRRDGCRRPVFFNELTSFNIWFIHYLLYKCN